MTNKTRASIDSDLAIHPGVTLAEELEAREMTQKALAEAMDRPVQVVNEIANGKKAVTAETALQLERVLDIPACFWMNLQTDYDLTVARLAGRKRAEWDVATT
jgi:HTH-type transcriptional regulator / antitoxin HigA